LRQGVGHVSDIYFSPFQAHKVQLVSVACHWKNSHAMFAFHDRNWKLTDFRRNATGISPKVFQAFGEVLGLFFVKTGLRGRELRLRGRK
jgi:hypothetical protein